LVAPLTTAWGGGGGGEEGSGVIRKKERETGGQAQFDWMLDGGRMKAQPIRPLLICC
jgi:hypothetical protein